MLNELRHIDMLVRGCYDAMSSDSFSDFAAFSACYFAAATTWERRRLAGDRPGFLLADDSAFQSVVGRLRASLTLPQSDTDFAACAAELLAPWDHVNLFSPSIPNMHGRTALPES